MVIQYSIPDHWIKYEPTEIVSELTQAKAAVLSLTSIPFQRSWAEALQEIELKREVAGTSKIEGADFTEREFEEAVAGDADEGRLTRSQKQARAAIQTYRWIAKLPADFAVSTDLIHNIHRRIVMGCDDDHCAPGELRGLDQNVTFGRPRHRGASGGDEVNVAFRRLCGAINQEFRGHDGLIQALATHYHVGAIHPYQDGNGRTARALEALLLKRAELKDTLFIAMSNYYYDEKDAYLATLSTVANNGHNLTPFLQFGLKGIAAQAYRLLREIRRHVSRTLYREVMYQMYGRLKSTRRRALAERQLAILEQLLHRDGYMNVEDLMTEVDNVYSQLTAGQKAFIRDINELLNLKALHLKTEDKPLPGRGFFSKYSVTARLDWSTEITETDFYAEINKMPQAKIRLVGSRWG
jgi:Fic family protein